MKVIVDRVEGDYVVCEKDNKEMMNIKRDKIPSHVKEGDVLIIDGNSITIDIEQTYRRRKKIEGMTKALWG